MRTLLVVAMAALMAFAAPATAFAQIEERPSRASAESDIERLATGDVDSVKDRAQAAIDRRLETIDRLRERVTSHPHVTGSHQGELLGELGRSEAGLNTLSAEIRQAETIEELRELVPKIATDFRIYLVVAPKVKQVLGSDTVVAVGDRLEDAAARLGDWIARAVEAGVDVTEAQAHFEDMWAETAAAVGLGGPVAGTVLPLTPADWPDPARSVLEQGRADLMEARELLRAARHSARETFQALRTAFAN